MRWVALVCLTTSVAWGDPQLIKIGTIAPDGTYYARELRAFARDIEGESDGVVKVKIFFGAIAGDEDQMGERVRRGQLDGVASAGPLCTQLAPSIGVMGLMGLFQTRDESSFVVTKLKPLFDAEFAKSGYINLGEASIGPVIIFSRKPITDYAELRKTPLWAWSIDPRTQKQLELLGLDLVRAPIYEAARTYADGRTDAILGTPSGALAFQWHAQTHFFSDLRLSFLTACIALSNRAFDPLPTGAKRAIRTAAAKLQVRFEDAGRAVDDQLLGGLFEKRGLQLVRASDAFRAQFFEAARLAREKLGSDIVSPSLLGRVQGYLADYRAEHPLGAPSGP
jgi:TRAP-type C4-dicarboxylate transport system substrate-binding protein